MARYQQMFERLKQQQQVAFIPFVMLGDPNLETSFEIIKTLIESGADALELGIPFSDPVADGPTIQEASIRALANSVTPAQCFSLLEKIREFSKDIPIGLLVYSNLVYRNGIENFYQRCQAAQVDSVLIADVPLRETELFDRHAKRADIAPVHILPPNPSEQTLMQVAKRSCGYTYILGRAGVTGTETSAQMPAQQTLQSLRDYQAAPQVMGFGISQPTQVQQAKAAGFEGVISGSAVVKIIAENLADKPEMLARLADFIQRMKAATT
ncbi:MAG: tryptophan synthase subunit alpha [Gammaproteobacteria bacterium]|nr:tryptophan synthase subunit alpha [Gammaproteobacteria bacterium]